MRSWQANACDVLEQIQLNQRILKLGHRDQKFAMFLHTSNKEDYLITSLHPKFVLFPYTLKAKSSPIRSLQPKAMLLLHKLEKNFANVIHEFRLGSTPK